MKKILNALFLTLLAVFTFSSCSDVPAPYDILGEGDVPGLPGDGSKRSVYFLSLLSLPDLNAVLVESPAVARFCQPCCPPKAASLCSPHF